MILIHGAWQGAWVWESFSPLLAAEGFKPIAVDLPGNGTDDTPPDAVTLDLYVEHVCDIVARQAGPVILMGIPVAASSSRRWRNAFPIASPASSMLPA